MSIVGLAGAGHALCIQLFHVHAPTTNSSDSMLYVAYIVVDVSATGLYRRRFSLMDDAMQGERWGKLPCDDEVRWNEVERSNDVGARRCAAT